MSEIDMTLFEQRLEARLRRHAAVDVRPFDPARIAQLAHESAGSHRMPWFSPIPRSRPGWLTPVLIGLLLLAALAAAAFIGAQLLRDDPYPYPPMGSNGLIAYTVGRTDRLNDASIHLASANGSRDQVLVDGSAARFSMDGHHLAYVYGWSSRPEKVHLVVADADGSDPREAPGYRFIGYALSPDGSHVAMSYVDPRGNVTGEIWTWSMATGEATPLLAAPADFPESSYELSGSAWSPDGRWLAVSVMRGIDINGPYRVALLVVDAHTGEARLASSRMSTSSEIGWSPDSSAIAFVGWPDGTPGPTTNFQGLPPPRDAEIFTVGLDGTGERQLTHDSPFADLPKWAPNGSAIAYTHRLSVDPQVRIAMVPLDEEGVAGASIIGPAGDHPTWSADSTTIAYAYNSSDSALGDHLLQTVAATDLASAPVTLVRVDDVITSIAWQRLDP